MAKLYFRYGTVSSAKTLNLLAVAENYRIQGRGIVLIKPKLDSRFGLNIIKSRAGLESPADIVLDGEDENGSQPLHALPSLKDLDVYCVLVDEAQFLTSGRIEELREIATSLNIPVICYGLRTDFKSRLFPAAKRLFELADSIEEIKTTCYYCCRSKATMNLKHVDGVAAITGPSVQLGCEESYFPTCFRCYKLKHAEASPKLVDRESQALLFPSADSP